MDEAGEAMQARARAAIARINDLERETFLLRARVDTLEAICRHLSRAMVYELCVKDYYQEDLRALQDAPWPDEKRK